MRWYDAWVIHTDPTGNVKWQQVLTGPKANKEEFIQAVAPHPDGGVVGVGSCNGVAFTDNSNGWVTHFDKSGNLLWQRSIEDIDGGHSFVKSATVLVNGDILLAGGNSAATGNDAPWLMRIDAFGNFDCKESGTCLNKPPADCDDKNPCTADTCDGKLGCQHSNLADTSPCGDGKSCKIGVCQ